jgi:hypothetical protein
LGLWADIIGISAGFFLTLPAAKDNIYRFIEARHRQQRTASSWSGLRTIIADVWKERRDSYSAFDTWCILLGGFCLMVSFALKLASS